MALAAAVLTDRAADALAAAGLPALRPAHGRLFAQLLQGERTVSELAAALDVTPQAVSKTLGPLVAEGYVEVRPAREDARRRVVALAPRGHEAVVAAREARREVAAAHGTRLARARSELLAVLEELGVLDDVLARRRLP